MTVTFGLAIAAAYAGKSNAKTLFFDSEQLVSGSCQQANTGCNLNGNRDCAVTAYKIPAAGEAHCDILLTKRP